MTVFWETIAAYNAATWPVQILLVAVGIALTLLLCFRPTTAVKNAMKVFMALLNFWIAFVYYHIYCEPREYNDLLTLFWAIMGCMWIYDLAARNATLERTGHHTGFALLLFAMPFIYPLCSLALGREFPMITSPVMPCSVAVFTLALMLAAAAEQALAARTQRPARRAVHHHRPVHRLHAPAPVQPLLGDLMRPGNRTGQHNTKQSGREPYSSRPLCFMAAPRQRSGSMRKPRL